MGKPRWFSSSQNVVSSLTRTFGFLLDGDGLVADPHQSPFWIKAAGLPLAGDRHPAPGCSQPQKFLGALPCPSVPDLFGEAARERWTVCVHRERVATGAVRVHRSLGTPRWKVQPLAGSMTEAHQSKSFAPRQCRGMRWRPNQIWWLSANPLASSPPQPEIYLFMQMPCSRQTVPDRAGCSSRPAPACGPPS
jgi:hypothetical protein